MSSLVPSTPDFMLRPRYPLIVSQPRPDMNKPPVMPRLLDGRLVVFQIIYNQYTDFLDQVSLSKTCRTMYSFVWSQAAQNAPRLLAQLKSRTIPLNNISWNELCTYRMTLSCILRRPARPTEIQQCFPEEITITHRYRPKNEQWEANDVIFSKYDKDAKKISAIKNLPPEERMARWEELQKMGVLATSEQMEEARAKAMEPKPIVTQLAEIFPGGTHTNKPNLERVEEPFGGGSYYAETNWTLTYTVEPDTYSTSEEEDEEVVTN